MNKIGKKRQASKPITSKDVLASLPEQVIELLSEHDVACMDLSAALQQLAPLIPATDQLLLQSLVNIAHATTIAKQNLAWALIRAHLDNQ